MPKEVLIHATRGARNRFSESHNPDLFNLVNINSLKANCRYFLTFIGKFDKAIGVVGN